MNSSLPGTERAPTASSLLAVFAHPDDESLACGGLLAMAADHGVRVSLVCASRGERRGAAGARADELSAAARVLGISDVMLLDYEDGMLPWVDAWSLERDIRDAIARTRANAVVTFGADGLYWHPDHIAVHERTAAAVASLGDSAPALYYVTMPPGQMRGVMNAAVANAHALGLPAPRLVLGIDNPDAFGAEAAAPTAVVDVSAAASRKLAAIRCHASQLRDDVFTLLTDGDAERLLNIEHFHRAQVGSRQSGLLESLACAAISEETEGTDSHGGTEQRRKNVRVPKTP